jgi:hypothetical protein
MCYNKIYQPTEENIMRKFKVTGGLGRLCRFPKTVEVEALTYEDAHWTAMGIIRQLITEEDFGGDRTARMLSKVICTDTIEEID